MNKELRDVFPTEFYGIKTEIINHQIWGAPANALIVRLPEATDMLSSREGFKTIKTACNCYLPKSVCREFDTSPDAWNRYLKEVLNEAKSSADEATTLSTGVSMDFLSWQEEKFDELWVVALVTAGVSTNAMRVGKDKASGVQRNGQFEKIGTINSILLTSAELELTAMAASFITITEAKNIALQEMDVRSTVNPEWQATGTGTDEIMVISGKGNKYAYVGGHTKIGELMAKAVTSATVCAIEKNFGNDR